MLIGKFCSAIALYSSVSAPGAPPGSIAIIEASIRSHLAEELVYGFVIIWELRTFVGNGFSIFPASDTELGVPALIQGLGADVSAYRGRTCLAAARLID